MEQMIEENVIPRGETADEKIVFSEFETNIIAGDVYSV